MLEHEVLSAAEEQAREARDLEHWAACKIQAWWRGSMVRKGMRKMGKARRRKKS